MIEMRLLSSLAKVFTHEVPPKRPMNAWLSALHNERVSLQAAYKQKNGSEMWGSIHVDAPEGVTVVMRRVRSVPGYFPLRFKSDDAYIKTEDHLYPDLLEPLPKGNEWLILISGAWQSVWIDLHVSGCVNAGKHPVSVTIMSKTGDVLAKEYTTLTVVAQTLPPLSIVRTQWFHADCLAQYYQVDVFSERHWDIIENFITCAAKHGINTILTPIHTPPLDTEVGGERLTTQLIDVTVKDGVYAFNFEKLERWINMCQRVGIVYFEMAHLFTQWGAKHAPKIMGIKDDVYCRLFGWETDATGAEYQSYLSQLLPLLTKKLAEWGICERTIFHISDEPRLNDLDAYLAAHKVVSPYLSGYKIVDALSNYDFYEKGAVFVPVPSVDHLLPFISGNLPEVWCYYCCTQSADVPNHFFMLPSYRNRILGVLMYKYNIQGFLHWGYNFYNSVHSVYPVNPFVVTDADGAFPSGDAFMVYPGADGIPIASLRLLVAQEGFCDFEALNLLAQKIGREKVLAMIDDGLATPITFTDFPQTEEYLINLRFKVNEMIGQHC